MKRAGKWLVDAGLLHAQRHRVLALGLVSCGPTRIQGPAPAVLVTRQSILSAVLPAHLTAAQAADLDLRLAPVIQDLAHGSPHLSAERRGQLSDAARDMVGGAR